VGWLRGLATDDISKDFFRLQHRRPNPIQETISFGASQDAA